jgi:hypothetical protein
MAWYRDSFTFFTLQYHFEGDGELCGIVELQRSDYKREVNGK